MKLQIKSNFSFTKLGTYIRGRVFSTKTGQIFGSHIAKSSREFIESGKVKPPLKKSTLDIRRNRGGSGSRPLFETGALARSLKATKDGHLSMEHYGAKHLKEHYTDAGSMIPGKLVPARDFISYGMERINEPFGELMANIIRAFKK